MRALFAFAAGLLLQGCATIVEGTGQNVSVSTSPSGATCTVDRGGGRLGIISPTPGTLHIQKSKDDLAVMCSKPGFETAIRNHPPKFVATTVANILLGGLVGVVVDAASGANYQYPGEVRLDLVPLPPASAQAAPQPHAAPMS